MAAVVHEGVVGGAQEDEVLEARLTAQRPVVQVVRVEEPGQRVFAGGPDRGQPWDGDPGRRYESK